MTHRMPTHRAHTGLYHVVAFIAGREAGQSQRREGVRERGKRGFRITGIDAWGLLEGVQHK